MDNDKGTLLKLHPLMDHDHAFSDDLDIHSQTSETDETLKIAAIEAIKKINIDLSGILKMQKPGQLNSVEWQGVLDRTKEILIYAKNDDI